MTNQQPSSYGSAKDWAQIISGAGQGASSAFQSTAALANNKRDAKEAKRRTLANMMSRVKGRNQSLSNIRREYRNDIQDNKSQTIQDMARGFISALQGSN